MRPREAFLLIVCLLPMGDAVAASPDPWHYLPERSVPTDHSTFFKGPFADGPSVTKACLECHPKAASEIMQTAHWNLVGDEVTVPGHEEPVRIGKRNLINNFCIGIKSNWPGCTSCHVGFGWEDDSFDLTDESLVDCLVCHEQTGNYHKDAGDAGRPAADVDLLASAKSVGNPTRGNCGACHFMAGGGNAVKHGDLDESLLFPNPEIDVHMGKLGFQCIDCHQAEDHLPPGRLLTVSVDDKNRLFCTNCHKGEQIHADRRIDGHTDRVACQTCHIPLMAVKTGTKLSWDWSQAGQDLPITNEHLYLKIKGRFTWVKGAQPEYAWYNGSGSRYLLGDKIDPGKVYPDCGPAGRPRGPGRPGSIRSRSIAASRSTTPNTGTSYCLIRSVTRASGRSSTGTMRCESAPRSRDCLSAVNTTLHRPRCTCRRTTWWSARRRHCSARTATASRAEWTGRRWDTMTIPCGRAVLEHEPIPLLDAEGEMVHESGNPLSTSRPAASATR